jgi:hypothetical protein
MKDDLKRLLNEFLTETYKYRTEKVNVQFTDKSLERYEYKTREATLTDLIDWLNDRIESD